MTQKYLRMASTPKNSHFFPKPQRNIKIQNSKPNKIALAYEAGKLKPNPCPAE